ncbi:GrpB-like predicted nucleotidyltransferase (UPF0157 family) [Chryseobacterium sp. H1D6B]|uniref:GrpB family protein n=1 Tax=Chryseobacterium sp. H1D6B TaxID=2940588 RepID=UPI0015C7A683|nr:GrpB family protein [Chryseobacterium sp. H1D6B]MDH6254437.1 GrpB-like predicted nucleotidyltransferase (UPF0157 family) [Chryseobacterium sp. H1D6B]
MKIKLEKYNPGWKNDFKKIKTELMDLIGFIDPKIEHIGSTSIENLSAKPIIDILIGVNDEGDLEKTIVPLTENNYVYYEKYNKMMPYRRFFVKHTINPEELDVPVIITEQDDAPSNTNEHDHRLAHIHILPYNSEHWIRHIAFRDYMRIHPEIKDKYQKLKEELSIKEWSDGNEYNGAKDHFIKIEEKKAIDWYCGK